MENPASRKRVAEQRIRQVVDPKIEKSKIGVNKDKINRNVAKRTAEKEALQAIIDKANEELQGEQQKLDQKKQLAEETKKLIDKRKNTKSREEKKELTKQIDKNEDAFEKLTYEEAGELYSKPKEVVEEEANEQAGKDEFNKAMNENETPQKTEAEIEKKYVEPVETFYHASDTAIDTFDLSKTKLDQNGIGLAVNTKSENAYKDKPNQYEFD